MRHKHKREDYDFRELKDSTAAPSALKRARGGRADDPESRQEADSHERQASKDHLKTHTKRRPARSTKRKAVEMSGKPPRQRLDRPRRKKFADGGSPYSGASGYVPTVAIVPGHTIPTGAPPQDTTMQAAAAALGAWGKQNNSNSNNSNSNWTPDLGYAVYNNGTPVGIMGAAPFAGGPDDIGSKRGGRISRHRPKAKAKNRRAG
jgi:hypothetical protein